MVVPTLDDLSIVGMYPEVERSGKWEVLIEFYDAANNSQFMECIIFDTRPTPKDKAVAINNKKQEIIERIEKSIAIDSNQPQIPQPNIHGDLNGSNPIG